MSTRDASFTAAGVLFGLIAAVLVTDDVRLLLCFCGGLLIGAALNIFRGVLRGGGAR